MPSGSKPISGFADGTPPQVADDYVFERAGVTYRIQYAALQAAIIAAVSQTVTNNIMLQPIDGTDGEDAEAIPGAQGVQGLQGIQGIQGNPGVTGLNGQNAPFILPEFPDEPEDPLLVQGPRGVTGNVGNTGATGATGATTVILAEEPDSPDEPLIIPGPRGVSVPSSPSFMFGEFADEVDIPFVPHSIPFPDPFIGRYAPGSFTIPAGQYVVMSNHLRLIGTQRAIILGGDVVPPNFTAGGRLRIT